MLCMGVFFPVCARPGPWNKTPSIVLHVANGFGMLVAKINKQGETEGNYGQGFWNKPNLLLVSS